MSFAMLLLLYSLLTVGGCNDYVMSAEQLKQTVGFLKPRVEAMEKDKAKLLQIQDTLTQGVALLTRQVNEANRTGCPCNTAAFKPISCTDSRLVAMGTGVRTLTIFGDVFSVYCDQTTSGGGWTVFQRRFDGSVDFNRMWRYYEDGFGDKSREHWLGLRNIYRMVSKGQYILRVDLEDYSGNKAYAQFSDFRVSGPEDSYRLQVSNYSGTTAEIRRGLTYYNNMRFSTLDRDNDLNDRNCAADYRQAGFWFNDCGELNPNGIYKKSASEGRGESMTWFPWKGYAALKGMEMKFRPQGFEKSKGKF